MRLMFVGDISLGEHYFSFGHGPRSLVEKGEYLFKGVEQVFAEADYVIGNLEGPLSDINYIPTDPLSRVFRGSPCSVAQLKQAGINILNLANNHSLQHGDVCFCDTVERLHACGLKTIGLRNWGLEDDNLILDDGNGITVGVVAASCVPDNVDPDQQRYNRFDLDRLCMQVQLLTKRCVAVVVILHWGIEGHTKGDVKQKSIARRLIEYGARIVVGHHPHVFFEVEKLEGCVLAYSLGDFVFDLPWDSRLRKSGILDICISTNGSIDSVFIWPLTLNVNGIPKISGKPITIEKNGLFALYRCGQMLKFQSLKKFIFMALFLLNGDTITKLRFLSWKIKKYLEHF